MSWLLGEKAKASLEVGRRKLFSFYQNRSKSGRENLVVCISDSGSPLRCLSPGAGKFTLIPWSLENPLHASGKSSSRSLQDSQQSVGLAGSSSLPPFIIRGPMQWCFPMVDPSHIHLGGAAEDCNPNYPCNSWDFVNWTWCCCSKDYIFRKNHLTGGRWLAFNETLKEMGRGVDDREYAKIKKRN